MPYDPTIGLTPEQLDYARRLRAGLAAAPDPMAGALANNDGSSGGGPPPEGLPPAPPPTATDANMGAGGSSGAGPDVQAYTMPATAMASGAGGGSGDFTPPMAPTDQGVANSLRIGSTETVPKEIWQAAAQDRVAAAQAQAPAEQAAAAQGAAAGGGGGGGYAVRIPGGPRVQGWNITEQRGPQTPYELRLAYSDSMGQLAQATRDRAEVEAERAAFGAQVAKENAAAERAHFLDQARLRKEADYAQARDQVQSARDIVGGPLGAIGAAIVMGLGEFAARRPGGSGINTAASIINKQIDQEMQRQEKAIQIRRMGREERALRLANMRSAYYDQVKQRIAEKTAQLGTREAEIQGRELTAKIDLEHNRWETEAARLALGQTQVATSIANVPDRTVYAGGGGGSKPKSESRDLMIPGFGVANTAKDADEGRKMVAATNQVLGLISDINEASKTWMDRATPKNRGIIASKKASLLLAVKNAESMGALDKGTQEIARDLMGSPESITDFGGRTAGLAAMADTARRNLKERLDSMGVSPAKQSVEQGPKGPAVRVALTGDQSRKPKTAAQAPSFQPVGK